MLQYKTSAFLFNKMISKLVPNAFAISDKADMGLSQWWKAWTSGMQAINITNLQAAVFGIFLRWWRHQMETFSALLALCEGNSPVTGEFPSQRLVTRNVDVFLDLRLIKRLSKPSRRRWFEMPSRSLWRHCNACSVHRCLLSLCHQIWKKSNAKILRL